MKEISISKIKKSSTNPRQDLGDIEDLAKSIKAKGILQPPIVRQINDEEYELVIGSRRLEACKLLGIKKVKCLIEGYDSEEALNVGYVENHKRKDLTWTEDALVYLRKRNQGKTTKEISNELQESEDRIKKVLLSHEVVEKVQRCTELEYSFVYEIRNRMPEGDWNFIIEKVINENLSYRDILKLANNAKKVIIRLGQLEITHPDIAREVKKFWHPLRYENIYRNMEQEIAIRIGQPKRIEYFIPESKSTEEEARQYAEEKHGQYLGKVTKTWYRVYIIPYTIEELRSKYVE